MTTIFPGPDENGDNGMPWQVKAIGLIGVPSALAIYFSYSIVGDIRINQQNVKENLALHSTQTQSVMEQNRQLLISLDNLKRTMDKICANTARNYTERNECFR